MKFPIFYLPESKDEEKKKILENAVLKATRHPDFTAWMAKVSTAKPISLSADAYKREIEELAKIAEKYKRFSSTN